MKDAKLQSILKGCRLNDRIFSSLLKKLRRGEFETERDISRFIKKEIFKARGALAFPPIVAIGKNAVDWHHKPTNSKLRNGGFCVIDFGSRFKRYCSDMTRTVYFGKANSAEKKIYAKVRRANEICITKVRAGKDGHEIYMLARKILGSHAKYFGHGLGHGLKKIIHAKPRLSKKPNQILREGDIITIEPGVYIPKKLGIRIEDDVLVAKKGYRLLSRSTKKVVEINAKQIF
ncbi:MAG TPA: M24 family metallopeptidase [archaeon]|nr:M24 family metallopeptidase [archaeon]